MLKIDIDGFDRDVLASILLAGYRPDFIQLEIQPEFPPPLVFSVIYHPAYKPKYGYGGFYGCSISAIHSHPTGIEEKMVGSLRWTCHTAGS